jgi:transposase
MKSKLHPFTDEIVRRYQDGTTAEALAQEYGVGESTMRHFLKAICGIVMRPPNRGRKPQSPQEHEQEIVREYQAGDSMTLIASRHQIGYDAVRSIMRRYGATIGRRLHSPSIHLPTSEAQLGYIAALVDGEGCIRIFEDTIRHRVVVRIANTDRPLMEWLAQFGGTIHWYKRSTQPHWKTAGTWTVAQAIDAYHLLIAIEPYMIIKRSRAQEAIRYLREHWHFT